MNFREKIASLGSSRTVKISTATALILLLVWYLFKPRAVPSEIIKVQKGEYEDFLEEEGMTRVREKFIIYSPVNGILRRVELHAGDMVKKGQKLFSVDWEFFKEVKSPVTGEILRVMRESAGPVVMQEPIMEIGDTRDLEIVAEVLTQDAVKINKGDQVKITGWGGGALTGKVRLIEPSGYTKISSLGVEEQRTRVLIDFTAPENMGEAFKVQCRVLFKKLPDRLIVPSSALFREGQDWAVFIVEKKRAKKVIVKIEARNSSNASISEGLAEGMEIILYPSENIKDGVLVNMP